MKPNEGRLQSAEHILARVLKNQLKGITIGRSKFKKNNAYLDINSSEDLRELDAKEIITKVNEVISRNIKVNKPVLSREEAKKIADLGKVPNSVQKVTIIDFEGFDKTPCGDPHVNNTKEIGRFSILAIKKVGSDRYRFSFKVN
jgi:Ser-tRNA(Ala) deacylase AlaX